MARKKGVQKGTEIKNVKVVWRNDPPFTITKVKRTKGGSYFIQAKENPSWQRVTRWQGEYFWNYKKKKFEDGGDVKTLQRIAKALAKGSKTHKKQSKQLEGASKSHKAQSKELNKIAKDLNESKFAKGGITKGKSHAEGGIPMVVKSTGQKVELEGGEGVINKKNMADTKKHEFEGKMLTKCEIASEINSDGGNGVEIDCDGVTGKKYKHEDGGKVNESGKPYWDYAFYIYDFRLGILQGFDSHEEANKVLMDMIEKDKSRKQDLYILNNREANNMGAWYKDGGEIERRQRRYEKDIGEETFYYGTKPETDYTNPSNWDKERYLGMTRIPEMDTRIGHSDYLTTSMKDDKFLNDAFADGGEISDWNDLSNIPFSKNDVITIQNERYVVSQLNSTEYGQKVVFIGIDENNRGVGKQILFDPSGSILRIKEYAKGGEVEDEREDLILEIMNISINPFDDYELNNFSIDRLKYEVQNLREQTIAKVREENREKERRYNEMVRALEEQGELYEKGGMTDDYSNYHWYVYDKENDQLVNAFEKEYKEDAFDYIENESQDDPEYRKNFVVISKRKKEELGLAYPPTYDDGGIVDMDDPNYEFRVVDSGTITQDEIKEIKADLFRPSEDAIFETDETIDYWGMETLEEGGMVRPSKVLRDYDKNCSRKMKTKSMAMGGLTSTSLTDVEFNRDVEIDVYSQEGNFLYSWEAEDGVMYGFHFLYMDKADNEVHFMMDGSNDVFSVKRNLIDIEGYDFELGGKVGKTPYSKYDISEQDKDIMNLLRSKPNTDSYDVDMQEFISNFKGYNIANKIDTEIIDKIYGLLFKHKPSQLEIKNLLIANGGVGKLENQSPDDVDIVVVGHSVSPDKFTRIEQKISDIINKDKENIEYVDFVYATTFDAIINVQRAKNPSFVLNDLGRWSELRKGMCIVVELSTFDSMDKLNNYKGHINRNYVEQGKASVIYAQVNEGLTDDTNYSLFTILKYGY